MEIPNKQLKPIQLQVSLIPVCKMVIQFGLHFHEFTRNLQKAYIKAAKELLKESKIKPSLQAIAIKTGMDRRTISEHIKNINKSYSNPMNKMDMLIVQLQRYCIHSDENKITLDDLCRIIDSIYGGHIRSGAITKELLSNGIISQLEKKLYEVKFTVQQQLNDVALMANEVDYTAKRLFETYYKNMFSNIDKGKKKLAQSTCQSTKVPIRHHNIVNCLIKKELEESQLRLKSILKKYESNVPKNTFPEIGASQFQFDSQ